MNTGPLYKGNKVRFKNSYYKEEMHGKVGIIYNIKSNSEYYVKVDDTIYWVHKSDIESYIETENNMEEKELNLCEILKGYEGEEFYYLLSGKKVILDSIKYGIISIKTSDNGANLLPNSAAIKGGIELLYPSKELYEKYPLDAYSAWMEWKNSKKKIELFFDMKIAEENSDELLSSEYVLYEFNSYEEANQATEVVKEALQKFYGKNNKNESS